MQRSNWILLLAIATISTVALMVCAPGTQAQSTRSGWGLVANAVPPSASLSDVFMLDQNNAWIASSEGSIGKAYRLQYLDGNWRVIGSETGTFPSPALALVAVSDSNVWVVGDNGLLAHRDTTGWHTLTSPTPAAKLTTIQMLGTGEEGWAGGVLSSPPTGRPVMLHYKEGKWEQDTSITAPANLYRPANRLHFESGGGYTVGINQVWRYDGSHWVEEALPVPPMCVYTLTGVRTINKDEAWATGGVQCSGPPNPGPVLLHRVNGLWQEVLRSQGILDDPAGGSGWAGLSAISFTNDESGFAVGGQAPYGKFLPFVPFVISYKADARWHYESTPDVQSTLQSVSQVDADHALAVGTNGIILSYGYGPGAPVPTATPIYTPVPAPTRLPSDRISDPRNSLVTYFPVAGHTLTGGFRDYWTAHGGLPQFGYPVSEEFQEVSPTDGRLYTVQYFERARFEWHPENHPPYDVLLGLLGRTVAHGREDEPPFQAASPQTNPGYIYFQPVRHNLAAEFALYWQHGGLPVYGYPISEPFSEVSPTDGKPYLVQYFERNRLEYHPELSEPYRVSLGLLGVQILKERGWIR